MEDYNWISITNIIATIILSIFVCIAAWKSANAAKATNKLTSESLQLTKETKILNENIYIRQIEEKQQLREALRVQYVDILWKKSRDILLALDGTDGNKIHRNFTDMKIDHNITHENLAHVFDPEEVKKIHKAWFVLNEYLDSHLKSTYYGNEIGALVTYADKPIEQVTIVRDLMTNLRNK